MSYDPDERATWRLIFVALLFAVLAGVFARHCGGVAHARAPRPRPEAELEARGAWQLTLAQALVGEADWHRPDHEAIAWVLFKRWQMYARTHPNVPFEDFIPMYSAPLKTSEPRARYIQALRWGTFAGPGDEAPAARWVDWALHDRRTPGGWEGERWDKVRRLVVDWGHGRVRDPCPRALHWGGTMDKPKYGWKPTNCGFTNNIFYSRQTTRR